MLRREVYSAGLTVRVAPNPFTTPVSLIVSAPSAAAAVFSVTDMNGRKLAERNVILQQGDNAFEPAMIARLPAGIYQLTVTTQIQQQTIKFVKE